MDDILVAPLREVLDEQHSSWTQTVVRTPMSFSRRLTDPATGPAGTHQPHPTWLAVLEAHAKVVVNLIPSEQQDASQQRTMDLVVMGRHDNVDTVVKIMAAATAGKLSLSTCFDSAVIPVDNLADPPPHHLQALIKSHVDPIPLQVFDTPITRQVTEQYRAFALQLARLQAAQDLHIPGGNTATDSTHQTGPSSSLAEKQSRLIGTDSTVSISPQPEVDAAPVDVTLDTAAEDDGNGDLIDLRREYLAVSQLEARLASQDTGESSAILQQLENVTVEMIQNNAKERALLTAAAQQLWGDDQDLQQSIKAILPNRLASISRRWTAWLLAEKRKILSDAPATLFEL